VGLGADLREADLKVPSSLKDVCRGIDAVLTTASSTVSWQPGDTIQSVDLEGQCNLIDAAAAAGVQHFTYVSYSPGMDLDDLSPLGLAKRGVEAHLRNSGLTYTILQPAYYMESWLSPEHGFDYVNATVHVAGTGDERISWIARGDVARFATLTLTNPASKNATWELGGPQALSPLEVIALFEEMTNRHFEVSRSTKEQLLAQLARASDPLHSSFASLMLALAKGNRIDMRPLLDICPVRLTTVQEYATSVLAALHESRVSR
jgi:uncharacterized protein YbjT (DUF2867 family)